MQNTITDRIKKIQKHLGIPVDGLIGPTTLTAIENHLFSKSVLKAVRKNTFLTVSRLGLKKLVSHEISSKSYYKKYLSHPTWPKGQSGVTIGIGYDLGYNSASQIREDWSGKLRDVDVERLTVVSGLKGTVAKQVVSRVKDIEVPLELAEEVFYESTLSRYSKQTQKAFPGAQDLHPDAQAALLSLVYNRGTKMTGSSRKEMAAIVPLVKQQDYAEIAVQIKAMKRLWEGKNLDGLLKRRDDEAKLVRNSDRAYDNEELVNV